MRKTIKKTKNKTSKSNSECPIETVLTLLNTKWKYTIIRELLDGEKRFGELKNDTGASQKSLTVNLREMEDDGLIERHEFREVPPRVEYSLSDIGYSLAPILEAMASWGTDYQKFCSLKQKIENAKNKD